MIYFMCYKGKNLAPPPPSLSTGVGFVFFASPLCFTKYLDYFYKISIIDLTFCRNSLILSASLPA